MRAVLFDLDGTLVDSLPDLAGALNGLLEISGLPSLDPAEIAPMIGNGSTTLVQRGFAARGVTLEGIALADAASRFLALYEPRATRETRLAPYVTETLTALAGQGVLLGVVTNKPTVATATILAAFGIDGFFSVVLGGDAGPARKPAPDLLIAALDVLGVAPAEAAMVGDSINDIAAAKTAGVRAIAVAGGYTAVPVEELGADVVIADLSGLADALD